ncbi:heparan-alpha-glucosaminide N-acetyltransferase-like [Diadema antillarum]|uniref:heparan-alpha-glucosaminide N-acetyltransferase-like n=1 Tax=Diadema antillarum TaxID=105358 RepID=UPI003A89FD64
MGKSVRSLERKVAKQTHKKEESSAVTSDNMTSSKCFMFVSFFIILLCGVLLGQSTDEADVRTYKDNEVLEHSTKDVTYKFDLNHGQASDTAFVYIVSGLDQQIFFWIQTKQCYECKYILLGPVSPRKTVELITDTTWAVDIVFNFDETDSSNATVCSMTYHFRQSGNYSLYVNYNKTSNNFACTRILSNNPPDVYIPIYVAMGILFGLAIFYILLRILWSSGSVLTFMVYLGMERAVSSDLGTPSNPVSTHDSNSIQRPSSDKPQRLKSLDAFRGLTITVMIFVNSGSGRYHAIFGHSTWNGLTVADLVFPWFIFIMGVSITMSFQALLRHGVSRRTMLLKVVRRFVILFGLGLILDGGTNLSKFRVPGVLQRIAASYLVVAVIHLASVKHRGEEYRVQNRLYCELRDILDYWYEWIIMLGLLALHICLTFLLPVPGCPTGYLGPGGPLVGEDNSLENCTGGAANYIDKVILTYDHVYAHGTARVVYQTVVAHDPEGILGTLTSIFLAFLGLQAGKIFHSFSYPRDRILRFFSWCIVTGLIAGALCNFSKEDGVIPVNKNLWSVSFVLTTGSMAYLLLSLFYYLIDVQHWWTGAPFFFVGMNSIAAYCGSEVMASYFPFTWDPVYGTHAELLAMDVLATSLWVLITYYMYTIKFFVKV